jgi:PAS domain-containing protein
MGAATLSLDPTLGAEGNGIDRPYLALAVAGVTFVVLSSALAAAAIQRTNIRYEALLREQNTLFEAALRHLPVGLSMFDRKQRLIMCNPAYRQLYGLSEEQTARGTSFADLVLDYV